MSRKLTENEAKIKIINKCKEISTSDEIISFLGFKSGKYLNNKTHLILHNSKFNLTWDTTSYSNFIRSKIKYPSLLYIKNYSIKKELRKGTIKYTSDNIRERIRTLYPTKHWDLSKTNY